MWKLSIAIDTNICFQCIFSIKYTVVYSFKGPLTYNDAGQAILVGVVSRGQGCALKDYPGIYARVTEVLPWIEEELAKTCWTILIIFYFLSNSIRKIKRCLILFGSLSFKNIAYLSIDYFWWNLFDIPRNTDSPNFCDEFFC